MLLKCEVCGRSPAKEMRFKSHHGYVVLRSEKVYEGVYCRDHAIMAASEARSGNLKGMWFGQYTLLFGTARLAWDSIKLLDLPAAVKDSPWEFHFTKCPNCSKANVSTSGECECSHCGNTYSIISCVYCDTVHVSRESKLEAAKLPTCCNCSKSSNQILAIRNSWQLLFSACFLQTVHFGFNKQLVGAEADLVTRIIQNVTSLDSATIGSLFGFSSEIIKRHWRLEVLRVPMPEDFKRFLLQILTACWMASCTNSDSKTAYVKAAKSLGFEMPYDQFIDEHFSESRGKDSPQDEGTFESSSCWWEILEVPRDSTLSDVRAAFHRKARSYHPDLHPSANSQEVDRLNAALKVFNQAFEIARNEIRARENQIDSADYGKSRNESKESSNKGDSNSDSSQRKSNATTESCPDVSDQTSDSQDATSDETACNARPSKDSEVNNSHPHDGLESVSPPESPDLCSKHSEAKAPESTLLGSDRDKESAEHVLEVGSIQQEVEESISHQKARAGSHQHLFNCEDETLIGSMQDPKVSTDERLEIDGVVRENALQQVSGSPARAPSIWGDLIWIYNTLSTSLVVLLIGTGFTVIVILAVRILPNIGESSSVDNERQIVATVGTKEKPSPSSSPASPIASAPLVRPDDSKQGLPAQRDPSPFIEIPSNERSIPPALIANEGPIFVRDLEIANEGGELVLWINLMNQFESERLRFSDANATLTKMLGNNFIAKGSTEFAFVTNKHRNMTIGASQRPRYIELRVPIRDTNQSRLVLIDGAVSSQRDWSTLDRREREILISSLQSSGRLSYQGFDKSKTTLPQINIELTSLRFDREIIEDIPIDFLPIEFQRHQRASRKRESQLYWDDMGIMADVISSKSNSPRMSLLTLVLRSDLSDYWPSSMFRGELTIGESKVLNSLTNIQTVRSWGFAPIGEDEGLLKWSFKGGSIFLTFDALRLSTITIKMN